MNEKDEKDEKDRDSAELAAAMKAGLPIEAALQLVVQRREARKLRREIEALVGGLNEDVSPADLALLTPTIQTLKELLDLVDERDAIEGVEASPATEAEAEEAEEEDPPHFDRVLHLTKEDDKASGEDDGNPEPQYSLTHQASHLIQACIEQNMHPQETTELFMRATSLCLVMKYRHLTRERKIEAFTADLDLTEKAFHILSKRAKN